MRYVIPERAPPAGGLGIGNPAFISLNDWIYTPPG